MQKIGVPQYFGIYYAAGKWAMWLSCDYHVITGVALIGEAIMSAAYHICPTGNNYQFGELYKCINIILLFS